MARSYPENKLNQRGSALITGMIAALSVGVVSAVIMQQSQVTERQTRVPRIKSAMAAAEAQIRESFNTGDLLVNCVSGDRGYGQPNCKKIDSQKLRSFSSGFPGAQCADPQACGVQIQDASYDIGTQTLTAKVVYYGTEVAIAPIDISTTINEDRWNSQNSQCPSDKPLLRGFTAEGQPICQSLPADCRPGRYVKRIDPMSLTGAGGVQCEEIPSSAACPAGQFINDARWNGPAGFIVGCQPSFNPFAANAIGDGTTYEYMTVVSFASSNWPTTTVPATVSTTTTTTTTTTLPPTTTRPPSMVLTMTPTSCMSTYRCQANPTRCPSPPTRGFRIGDTTDASGPVFENPSQWSISWSVGGSPLGSCQNLAWCSYTGGNYTISVTAVNNVDGRRLSSGRTCSWENRGL